MSGVWVVVEERDEQVSRIGWEAVAAGQRLAALTGVAVSAVVPGAETPAPAAEVAAKALSRVVRAGASAAGGVHGGWLFTGFTAVFCGGATGVCGLSA